jgi:hypothetical protein
MRGCYGDTSEADMMAGQLAKAKKIECLHGFNEMYSNSAMSRERRS